MSMPVRAVSNEHDDKRSSLIFALSEFTKQHRAAQWAGTFASFHESVSPPDARGIARSSHQYMWDMMRAKAELFSEELFGIDETLERVQDYFKAASAGSEVGRRLLLLLGRCRFASETARVSTLPFSLAWQPARHKRKEKTSC